MSNSLQIALFAMSVAVVLFVVLLIPCGLLLYRQVRTITAQLAELKSETMLLMTELRATIQNVNALTKRANQQLDELDKVLSVVQGWSARANQVVDQVGSAVEAPIAKVLRGLQKFRQIWSAITGHFTDQTDLDEPKTQRDPRSGTRPFSSPNNQTEGNPPAD